MSRTSHYVRVVMMSLLLATSLSSLIAAKTPQSKPAQSSTVSSQDNAKACNDAADKKGLKRPRAQNVHAELPEQGRKLRFRWQRESAGQGNCM
jgi:hypothetical protein